MSQVNRRQILQAAAIAPWATWSWQLGTAQLHGCEAVEGLKIATFRCDVTPPIGHSCCGGWIKPVEVVDDSLQAIGLIILGPEKPLVICSVDWTGLLNSAHIQWRAALAEAVGTTPDRVAVHCVHQHNAPFACLDAQELVSKYPELPAIVDRDFFKQCLTRVRAAARNAVNDAVPLTHVGLGQAKVEKIAANRRVARDDQGRITQMRGSSCRDEALRALPEGTIDPWLKSIAFYSGDRKVAVSHYYATHPMSFYADGRVSSDFAGLARKQLQEQQPDCCHLYFTGCAGNVAAGKYNDGSAEARKTLTQRLYTAMQASDQQLKKMPIRQLEWRTQELIPEPRGSFDAKALEKQIADPQQSIVNRNRPAYTLAWLNRVQHQTPIQLSSLRVNNLALLHLPAECFVEYQLSAQKLAPNLTVATAAYGDGGPWYIPTAAEYDCGGYEVSVAFCDRSVEEKLHQGMKFLLAAR
jgi:hypothetical protein